VHKYRSRNREGGIGSRWLIAVLAVAMIGIAARRPLPVAADTFTPDPSGGCGGDTYTVPAGSRYVKVVATGGAGQIGQGFNANNTGGAGGSGAKVNAVFPVTPGQTLNIVVGHNGSGADLFGGWPNGGGTLSKHGMGGGSSVVTTGVTVVSGAACLRPGVRGSDILVLAGGGGGGGGASAFGSGGNGGNGGANADFSGQAGTTAYHLDTDCGQGGGGGGGSATGVGGGGPGGCLASDGNAGTGFNGGDGSDTAEGGGSGGGGWYGGGAGGNGTGLGGGGGGAGSSHVDPSARASGVSQDTSGSPSVTITPYQTPTTTATLSGTTSGNAWYTSAPTVTLTAAAGEPGVSVAHTYYALDNSTCSATNLTACTIYSAPFLVSTNGLHTLTYFSLDTLGLDEAMQTKTFSVEPTTASVSAASIGSGSNPTANTGGSTGVTVSGSGSGTVGAAVYGSNPAGTATFNSSGAYVDVTVAGSGLTGLTITDCDLNGGTTVSWWNGTAWVLASNQTYDATTKCVTITVNSTTSPNLSQLTGTPFGAGSPPTITAVAKTADGKVYTSGTWTNQSVTVTFTCSVNATATAPVTRASDGANQTADGTCTDGVGQKTSTTFSYIDVDKTPPTCTVTVSPTTLWPPNGKPVAITGTVTAGDNLSGIASVVGGTVTSNETLATGDVQGLTINTTYAAPLKLSASVSVSGQLVATRAGSGNGRTYSQTITVTDQAGNTNTAPCTWTVTVPHDQGGGH
jgi:hypothetical protein